MQVSGIHYPEKRFSEWHWSSARWKSRVQILKYGIAAILPWEAVCQCHIKMKLQHQTDLWLGQPMRTLWANYHLMLGNVCAFLHGKMCCYYTICEGPYNNSFLFLVDKAQKFFSSFPVNNRLLFYIIDQSSVLCYLSQAFPSQSFRCLGFFQLCMCVYSTEKNKKLCLQHFDGLLSTIFEVCCYFLFFRIHFSQQVESTSNTNVVK